MFRGTLFVLAAAVIAAGLVTPSHAGLFKMQATGTVTEVFSIASGPAFVSDPIIMSGAQVEMTWMVDLAETEGSGSFDAGPDAEARNYTGAIGRMITRIGSGAKTKTFLTETLPTDTIAFTNDFGITTGGAETDRVSVTKTGVLPGDSAFGGADLDASNIRFEGPLFNTSDPSSPTSATIVNCDHGTNFSAQMGPLPAGGLLILSALGGPVLLRLRA